MLELKVRYPDGNPVGLECTVEACLGFSRLRLNDE